MFYVVCSTIHFHSYGVDIAWDTIMRFGKDPDDVSWWLLCC